MLVGDYHHLRGDDIERRDRNDQRQDDEHDALFDGDGAEEIGVALRPVANFGIGGKRREQIARNRGGREHVVKLEPYPAYRLAQPVELLRVGQVDQRETVVEFVHPDLEDAHDAKALDPRQRSRRRDRSLRDDDDNRVAYAHAERTRELGAEHDAELARLERGQRTHAHVCADIGNGILQRRIDTTHKRSAVHVPRGKHRLAQHVRRCGFDTRMRARRLRDLLPVRHFAVERAHLDMRGDGEDAVSKLVLEAVHHRQNHDERSHAERDAGHRSKRDERNKAVAPCTPTGTGVTQSNEKFVGGQRIRD